MGLWDSLLGPMTTWALTIPSIIWLYPFKEPSPGACRRPARLLWATAVLMLLLLIPALGGQIHMEDEELFTT